jgi:hypothetical protein
VSYKIDAGEILVGVEHEYLKDVRVLNYYGMQSMFLPKKDATGNTTNVRFLTNRGGDWEAGKRDGETPLYISKSDAPSFNRFSQKIPNGHYQNTVLLPYGLGNHEYVGDDGNVFIYSGDKAYHVLIHKQNIAEGSILSWMGIYNWNRPVADDECNYIYEYQGRENLSITAKKGYSDIVVPAPTRLCNTIINVKEDNKSIAIVKEVATDLHLTATASGSIVVSTNVESELVNRLQGKSTHSDSSTDPFKHLGDYATYDELNTVLNNLIYDKNITGKGHGYFRATVKYREVEIKNILLSSGENNIIQVVSGTFITNGTSLIQHDSRYSIVKRQRHMNSGWDNWVVVADSTQTQSGGGGGNISEEQLTEIYASIQREADRAAAKENELDGKITSEANRATSAEQSLQSNITSEADRAKEAERTLQTNISETNKELILRLQGKSTQSDSRFDAFKYLGDYTGENAYDDFNETLNILIYSETITGKGYGFFRATVGYRETEIQNILLSSGQSLFMQVVKGMLKIVDGKLTLDEYNYNILTRKHTADGWGEWSSMTDRVPQQVTDDITKLLNKNFPLEVKLTVPSVQEYTGSAKSLSFSWTTKVEDKDVTPTKLTLKVGGEEKSVALTDSSYTVSVNNDTEIQLDVEVGSRKTTATGKLNFAYPTYEGLVKGDFIITADNITQNLSKKLYDTRAKKVTYAAPKLQKIVYAYAQTYGVLQYIKDVNGYDIAQEFEIKTVDINSIPYYVYITKEEKNLDTNAVCQFESDK